MVEVFDSSWFVGFEVCMLVSNYIFLFLQLPECLRIIGYLRRIGVFSEYEMRLQVRDKGYEFFLWR